MTRMLRPASQMLSCNVNSYSFDRKLNSLGVWVVDRTCNNVQIFMIFEHFIRRKRWWNSHLVCFLWFTIDTLNQTSTQYILFAARYLFWREAYCFKAARIQLDLVGSWSSWERIVYLSSWRSCASDWGKNLFEKKEKAHLCVYRSSARKHKITGGGIHEFSYAASPHTALSTRCTKMQTRQLICA